MPKSAKRIFKHDLLTNAEMREILGAEFRTDNFSLEQLSAAYRYPIPPEFLSSAKDSIRRYNYFAVVLGRSQKVGAASEEIGKALTKIRQAADVLSGASFLGSFYDLNLATSDLASDQKEELAEKLQKTKQSGDRSVRQALVALRRIERKLNRIIEAARGGEVSASMEFANMGNNSKAYELALESALDTLEELEMRSSAGTGVVFSPAERLVHAFLPRDVGGREERTAEAFRRLARRRRSVTRAQGAQETSARIRLENSPFVRIERE